ncbi:MAG: ROK family protein [Haloarculaceae archaeon]
MYAGVDLGATNVRAAVADADGAIVGRDQRATPRGPSGIDVTEAVLDSIRAAAADAGTDPRDLRAVAIGSIGPLDLAAGAVDDPPNLPDSVERVPLTGPVEQLIGSERVYLHNDATAGVIGERFHSERNPDDMVYLTISSGIGAGVCVDGHVLTGWDGNAGEVGHLTVDPTGLLTCGCGKAGHWEAYCSGENLPRYARALADREDVPTDLAIDDPGFSAVDLFEAAGEDPLADHVLEKFVDWNVIGVTNIVHAYAPLVIYVGGGVALNNPERVLDPVRERLPETVMSNVPDLQLTTLGDDVGVEGAVASAMTSGTGDRRRIDR